MDSPDDLDVTILILSRERARLLCPQREDYAAAIQLDEELATRLLELENDKDYAGYGRALFAALFPAGSELARGLTTALDTARREERRLRLRFDVDPGIPSEVHAWHWELLTDGRDFAPARSPETLFSRYVPLPYPVGPAPHQPRLLCVIAAPIDAHRYQMALIDYDLTFRQLQTLFARFAGVLTVDFLERPVTPGRLRDQLQRGTYHFLHVHGHGMLPRNGEAALVLEKEDHQANFVSESALCSLLLGLHDLKLVTLVACHGGMPSAEDDQLTGLAGTLVRRGIPAVIAMRRAITHKMGLGFTEHLYPRLAMDPCLDAAVNEARHRLYIDNPRGVEWSSPVLYMRLPEGRLWSDGVGTPVPVPSRSERSLRTPILVVLALLLIFSLAWAYLLVEEPGDAVVSLPSSEEKAPAPQDESPPADPVSKPLPPPPPPPTIPVTAVVTGKVGVGAVSKNLAWSGEVARILVRQLRQQRPGLSPEVVPEPLRASLGGLRDGNFTVLPGGDRSPYGFEYILIATESHGPHAAATSRFPTVSVACDLLLVATRQREIRFEAAFSHSGQDTTEAGALDQAFGRCIESSLGELP